MPALIPDALLDDLRSALRTLRHRPGSSAAAILTLALGIGATTTLLGVVDRVLLRPLPYGAASELYSVWGVTDRFDRVQPSYPDFTDWRLAAPSARLAYAYGEVLGLRGDEGVRQVPGGAVSSGFFDVLGTPPFLGRTFAEEEERRGDPVVVVSHRLWRRDLGGDPAAVGTEVVLNGIPYTVIGVMPAGFEYPAWAELWVPLERVRTGVPAMTQRDARVDARAIARVPSDASVDRAEGELRAVADRLAAEHPATNRGLSIRLSSLRDEVVGEARGTLFLLGVAGALVLLLTSANVAAILLGRGMERGRDVAVRRALGADRGRLARQLVMENLVLAGLGGALGAALAAVALRTVGASAAGSGAMARLSIPRLQELGVDARLLGVGIGVTVVAALLFGVAPALAATAGEPALRVREQGRGGDVGRRAVRAQSALAVAQLAIALTLLGGAALLVRTLAELRRAEPGFEPSSLVVLRVFPSDANATADARLALFDRLAERAAAVAGVTGAGLINHMPYAGGFVPTSVTPRGGAPADTAVGALYRTVSPGFFDLIGSRMVRGREIGPAEAAADVVVLSEGLARSLWPSDDPVGRHVRLVNPTPPSPRRGETFEARVVGVVEDVRQTPRDDPVPAIYAPHARDPWGNIYVVARAAGDPASVVAPLRTALAEVDATIPVAELRPLAHLARDTTARERVLARLMATFAGVALLLSLVGIYGALSNLVTRRTREIGVRLAVGATPGDVRALVLRRAVFVLVPGTVLGIAGALGVARVMEGLLFRVPATDPVSLLVAAGLLGTAGLVAAWVPAVRAGRVDPVVLLGTE